ncbi:MAG: hypothetical protein IT349_08170, partial [Candidatus Eisenbacteria bacterium]|nr:hypothetical protein [Candidatus Eisenbacteria bacterium]
MLSAVNHERIESRSALIHPPVGRVVLSVCAALLLGGLALSLSTSLAQAEVTFVKPKGGSSSSGTSGSGSPAGGGPGGQSGGRLSGIRSAGNPAGPSVITIEDIRKQGLRRGLFVLSEETPLHVRAEGLSDPDGDVFLSYGYILDMKTRRPVWSMTDSDCCYDKKAENWRAEEEVTLPPGTYGVYYVAYGGKMPMKGKFKFFGLDLGEIDSDFGPTVEWDDEGDPERWGIWVTAMRTDFKPTPVSTALDQPFPDAVVNLLGVGNSTRKRVGLKLDRAVRFHLWATGEWWEGADDFADGASIIDQKSWRRIWQLERDNTVAAGGASKNRLFDDEITLPAGNYMVNVFTDDSHATDTWNTAPPWDPAAWGLALTPVNPADRNACHVVKNVVGESALLAIDRVGDNATICKPFVVKKRTAIAVHALGEKAGGIWADFGWIEDRKNLEPIWEMDTIATFPAGGAAKNREVQSYVVLDPGSYNLCYATDDSHAYDDWNDEPPYDSDLWGIQLLPLGDSAAGQVVPAPTSSGASGTDQTMISLAPAKDGQHVVKRFTSEGTTNVLLICVGEGVGDEMADYGWLE